MPLDRTFFRTTRGDSPGEQMLEPTGQERPFGRDLGELSGQFVTLAADLGQPLLELDDPADGRHRHALVGHSRDLLDDADLDARIAALAAGRTARGYDLEL